MVKNLRKILLIFSLVLLCLFSTILTTTTGVCYALFDTDGIIYTNVLEDLQKDSTFDTNDYIPNSSDYSLQVIQVAESEDKELFVYVFQPDSPNIDLIATSINISTGINNNLNYHNYKLQLLNSSGCFYKYKVRNFQVSNNSTRYYDISSIFRKWYAEYDTGLPQENENTITEVAFAVATRFTYQTNADGTISVSNNGVDVIYITDKYVGMVRYKESDAPAWIDNNSVDSHFVAFSTDRQIDKLLEADVYFVKQEITNIGYNVYSHDFAFNYCDNVTETYKHLNYTNSTDIVGEHHGLVWHSMTYSFKEIESVNEFIPENRNKIYDKGVLNSCVQTKISNEGLADIQNKDWVLRFYNSDYYIDTNQHAGSHNDHLVISSGLEYYDIVTDVSILRLKFETDGVVYNLGVVDNKQSGNGVPDNITSIDYSLSDTFKLILALLLLVILIVVLSPILPTLFSIIWWVIKAIFKAIWWVITLPFKIFKRKDKK